MWPEYPNGIIPVRFEPMSHITNTMSHITKLYHGMYSTWKHQRQAPGIHVAYDLRLIGVTKALANYHCSCYLQAQVQFWWGTRKRRLFDILGGSGGGLPYFWPTYSVVHPYAYLTLSFFASFRLVYQWCAPRTCGVPHLQPLPEDIWGGYL